MDDRNTNSFLIHYNRVGRIQRWGGRGSSPLLLEIQWSPSKSLLRTWGRREWEARGRRRKPSLNLSVDSSLVLYHRQLGAHQIKVCPWCRLRTGDDGCYWIITRKETPAIITNSQSPQHLAIVVTTATPSPQEPQEAKTITDPNCSFSRRNVFHFVWRLLQYTIPLSSTVVLLVFLFLTMGTMVICWMYIIWKNTAYNT
jgi:hypothetical protein